MRLRLLPLALLVSGCEVLTGTNEVPITAEVAPAAYTAGSVIRVEVTNRSRDDWHYVWNCYRTFQRQVDGRWEDAYPSACLAYSIQEESAAPAKLSVASVRIASGTRMELQFVLPDSVANGRHRVVLRFNAEEFGGKSVERASTAFDVLTFGLDQ